MLSFSGWLIHGNVTKMFNSQYNVNIRFSQPGSDMYHPFLHICYDNWALWVDFDLAYNEHNLNKFEWLTLMAPSNNEFHADQCPVENTSTILKDTMRKIAPKIDNILTSHHLNISIIVEKLNYDWSMASSIFPSTTDDQLMVCNRNMVTKKKTEIDLLVDIRDFYHISRFSEREIDSIER